MSDDYFQLHLDENYDESRRSPAAPECETKKSSSETKPDVVINMPVQDPHGVGSVLANMPHVGLLAAILQEVAAPGSQPPNARPPRQPLRFNSAF